MAGAASVSVEVTVAIFGDLAGGESDESLVALLSWSPGVFASVIDSSRNSETDAWEL